ncbi:hypothetical protein CIB48_g7518 [Xylaria polymorpha]|nr:hypothetical protein CIB48_g7518 [Xylaria polymorpha]
MSSNSRKCSGGERDKGRDQGGGGRLRSRVDSAAERWNTKRRRRARYREILPRLTPNPNPKNQERGVELLYWRLARKREAEPSAGAYLPIAQYTPTTHAVASVGTVTRARHVDALSMSRWRDRYAIGRPYDIHRETDDCMVLTVPEWRREQHGCGPTRYAAISIWGSSTVNQYL